MQRRTLLRGALLGTGLLGLRSLATGLPVNFLRSRSLALAAEPDDVGYLILASSGSGDPLNANCPGTYVTGTEHNPSALLFETAFSLGSAKTSAAKPWADLSSGLRSKMSFIHHRTYTNAHPEMNKVLGGHGAVTALDSNSQEMLPSVISRYLGDVRGTTQREPIAVGNVRLTYEGRPLDLVKPSELKSLFSEPSELEGMLKALRDQELDAVYAEVRQAGTKPQRAFLDRYAQGREQAGAIGSTLSALLTRLPLDADSQNGIQDQIVAAVALLKLNVAPVVSLHLPFGGDNHGDRELTDEAAQTVSGAAALEFLNAELEAAGLADKTTFASLNVFGRTLIRNSTGGRNHNGDHHAMCLFGPKVKGSVIGGIARGKRDFEATGIDASTGQSSADGNIAPEATLESAMRTLGAALGMPSEVLDGSISGGQVISGALV